MKPIRSLIRRCRGSKRLIRETERFLGGALDRSDDPALNSLNWLAHIDPTELGDRVRSELGLQRLPNTWEWATTVVARELIQSGGTNNQLVVRLQRECLLPMELTYLRNGPQQFLPEHLVALAVPRLQAHPAVHAQRPGRDESDQDRGR